MGEMVSIRTVLVVDHDEQLLVEAKRSLSRDRTVFTTTDPVKARQLAKRKRPDLAIVDLRLEAASGIDLVRELRADHPDLSIVMLSGYLSVVTAVAAVQAGADTVLFKPILYKELVRRIESGAADPTNLHDTPTLASVEWEHVHRVLADCNGNVSIAARRLGIYRSSLQRKLRKNAPRS